MRLFGSFQSFQNEALVWKTFLDDIHEFGREDDTIVIADATNLTNHYRRYYLEQTPEFDRHILVVFDASFELCEIRNKRRAAGKIVDDAAMKRLEDEWEAPSEEAIALFDEFIRVPD